MTQEISRIAVLMDVSADFVEVERLRSVNLSLKRHLNETLGQINVLNEEALQLETAITANCELLKSATQRIDGALAGLYQVAVAPVSAPAPEPVKTRGKKKEALQSIPVTAPQEGGATKPEAKAEQVEQKDMQPGKFPCPECGDVFYKESDMIEHARTDHKLILEPTTAAQDQPETAGVVEEVSDAEIAELKASTTFSPLDEAIGECELCMGYGVVEGELYGEATLLPCTCPAGEMVKGEPRRHPLATEKGEGVLKKCCEDCNIEDPDCASCQVPDMAATSPVEGPTIDKNRTCCFPKDRDWITVEGVQILFCRECRLIHRKTDLKGKDFTFTIGEKYEPAAAPEAPKPAPAKQSDLKSKCPHPKPFRHQTEAGLSCKVCGAVIEPNQAGLFAA